MNSLSSDLVLLVADKNMQFAVEGLLRRPERLGIRLIVFVVHVHPHRDPGCFLAAHKFLEPMVRQYAHALVVFDRMGCGREKRSRSVLENSVQKRLSRAGWKDRARAIVIDPELEQWVWIDSPEVPECLGWAGRQPDLHAWLTTNGLWAENAMKPSDPKIAVQRALEKVRRPRSSSIYRKMAERVDFGSCSDAAFHKLRITLQEWFPPEE